MDMLDLFQNITTHLIHHIAEDFAKFGPLCARWLFPFERANSWVTRQALNHRNTEATIMETYVLYDWCVSQMMSKRIPFQGPLGERLEKALEPKLPNIELGHVIRKRHLTHSQSSDLAAEYSADLGDTVRKSCIDPLCKDIRTESRNHSMFNKTKITTGSCVAFRDRNQVLNFAKVGGLFVHTFRGVDYAWAIVQCVSVSCPRGSSVEMRQ